MSVQTEVSSAAESAVSASPRLLLVEDNLINQKVAHLMLTRLGYQVDVASNGLEAIACLEAHSYQLILMDCQMPEMDGFEATRRIRARQDELAGIPIIALTANASLTDRDEALAIGMNDFITKPINLQQLGQILQRWLSPDLTSESVVGG